MTHKNKKYNTRGFTLIELLAVIVVLAIVMLIAVQAVIPRMTSARKQAFAIEANGAIEAAQAYILTASITSSDVVVTASDGACVPIDTLINEGFSDLNADKYDGYVIIRQQDSSGGATLYYYMVAMTNGQYYVKTDSVDTKTNKKQGKENNAVTEFMLTECNNNCGSENFGCP